METKKSISRFYLIFLIAITFFIVFIFGSIAIIELYSKFTKESENLKNEYIKDQKEIVKFEIESALNFIEWRKANSSLPEEDTKKEVLEWLAKIRFPNSGIEPGILFIRSFEGNLLMSASTPELIGKDISLQLDSDSINTHALFIKTAENPEGGYAEYSWYNPVTEIAGKKISYVKKVPEWEWYIGAGFWLDDINSVIELKRAEINHIVRRYVLIILLAMLLILIIVYFNLSFLTKKMNSSFRVFSEFFSKAERQFAKIDISKIEFSELKELADSANKMIEMREDAILAMRESEDRWQFALEGSGDGVWDYNADSNEVFFSKRWKEMLGYEEHEIANQFSEWKRIIHPEDKEKSLSIVEKFFNGETDFYENEHRLLCKDGSYKWILTRGKSFSWTKDNKPLRVIGTHIDLSQQKNFQKELMDEKEFSDKIIETSDAVIVGMDKDHLIRIFNRGAEKVTGYRKDEVIGKDWFELFFPANMMDEMTQVWKNAWVAPSHSYESIILSKTRKEKMVSFQSTGIYKGENINKQLLISIGEDITEKEKAKHDLELSIDKLESIFRAAPTGIGVVSNRIITEVNQRFCEMMGYKEEEILGKESIILYPSREEFEWVGKEKYEQINEKGTGTVETKFRHKDGHIIDVLLSSTPMDMNDHSVGVTFTALDITQKKKDVDELEQHRNHLEEIVKERTNDLENTQKALLKLVDDLNVQSRKLEYANKKLLDINDELETFTYSVSHDLKAPLRGIDGYSQLLLSSFTQDLNPDARDFLERIRKSTQQMNTLIEDLLAYSRMERKDFQTENILLIDLMNKLILQFSEIIKLKKVEIKLSFKEDFSLTADKDGLNLVLRNLIDNALKFSAKNDNPIIEIGGDENDQHWHLFVKDNGVGFDMKYHDRIYKIFQRLHLAEDYDGTGIGLAMVSKSMQRMNGKIWAESEPGEGACFHLIINKT